MVSSFAPKDRTVGARRQADLVRVHVHEPVGLEHGGKLLLAFEDRPPIVHAFGAWGRVLGLQILAEILTHLCAQVLVWVSERLYVLQRYLSSHRVGGSRKTYLS